jgi:hypothetical protein
VKDLGTAYSKLKTGGVNGGVECVTAIGRYDGDKNKKSNASDSSSG